MTLLESMLETKSLSSFVSGALFIDFENIKKAIVAAWDDLLLISTKSPGFLDRLMDESLRFLIINAVNCERYDEIGMRVSPSVLIDKALRCLILDPVKYQQVCKYILSVVKDDEYLSDNHVDILPYNQLDNEDSASHVIRFNRTISQYLMWFKVEPPVEFWTEIITTTTSTAYCKVVVASLTPTLSSTTHIIAVEDRSLKMLQFRLLDTTPFGKMFKAYAERKKSGCKNLKFYYKGKLLYKHQCPSDLNMNSNDIVKVY